MLDLQTPPTEAEVAEVIEVLNRAGMAGLGRHVRRLAYQRDRLWAMVDKLPKTADRVPVVPGMDTVWIDTHTVGLRQSNDIDRNGWASFGDKHGCCRSRRTTECYSTREAAEAAGGE